MKKVFLGRFALVSVTLMILVSFVLMLGCGGGEQAKPTPVGKQEVGVTQYTIKVGCPSYYTGAVGFIGKEYARGWEAAYRMVNDAGGINGRTIEWVSDDTAFDPTRAAAIATKLVTKDQIFAVAPVSDTTFHDATDAYFSANGVPVVGTDGLGAIQFQYNTEFAVGIPALVQGHMMGYYAYQHGMRKIAVGGIQYSTIGSDSNRGVEEAFTALGGTVAFSQQIAFDFTGHLGFVSRAQSEGCDGILFNGDITNFTNFLQASRTLDWTPAKGWCAAGPIDYVSSVQEYKDSAPEVYLISYGFDTIYEANPTPEMQLFMDSMEKYFPGEPIGGYTYVNWAGARLFMYLVEQMGNDITHENLVNLANNLENYDTGMGAKLTWKGNPSRVANAGTALIGVIQGKVTQLSPWTADPFFKGE